jgi:RNA polymerase sigma factor (sigma-70 family)
MDVTSGQLAAAAESGCRIVDPEDFEAAFHQHFEPVYRFIARRVGAALAEDLAAETFATAYRRRASFEPARGSLRSWLYGIATNLLRNHWRSEQRPYEERHESKHDGRVGTAWPGKLARHNAGMRPRQRPSRYSRS